MAFDRQRMRFYKGVVLTQAQWDQIEKDRPKTKMSAGAMMALVAGLTMGLTMERPKPRKPPTSLDDFG